MSSAPHVLVIDDQDAVREVCQAVAEDLGLRVTQAASAREALLCADQDSPDMLVSDVRLPDMNGLELLQRLRQRSPNLPVLMMTAYGSVASAVEAMKLGAMDYITKPFESDEMRHLMQAALRRLQSSQDVRSARLQGRAGMGLSNLIGASPQMQRIFRLISKVAQNRYPVLILGESGTGKEGVARALHYCGPDREKPFIPVDCGSLVPSLIESELFGYVKGAFTGANRNKEGLLEVAHGGTVFLDEIAELPVDLQSKLLRAIQEREIRPVGSNRRIKIDVRIIAATNRNLEIAVSEGSFRKDLFFRLNVVSIKLPPLRERTGDIPVLIDYFLDRFNLPGLPEKRFTAPALERLQRYEWPGNVRELENCVERAVALSGQTEMQIHDLPSPLQNAPLLPVRTGTEQIRPIADMEREAIMAALDHLKGDKLLAAKLLGIGKTTLYRKLKEYAVAEQV